MNYREVDPYPVDVYQNEDRLSKLKGYKRPKYTHFDPPYSVPILGTIDVDEILRQQRLKAPLTATNVAESTENSTVATTTVGDEVQNPLKRFVELDRLLPQNKQHQKATVALHNCPNLRKNATEKVLEIIVSLLPVKGLFLWSELTEGDLGDNNIFIRFSSVALAALFLALIPKFSDVYKVGISSELEASVEEIDNEKLKVLVSDVSKIVANKSNYGKSASKTGTEDLDSIMQQYSTYKVDDADLVDVPREMKEKIVREVVMFRSRVLTLERDARKKELEQERKKAKSRLTSIFQDIKESNNVAAQIDTVEDTEMEDDERGNTTDNMSEEDYLKLLEEAESKRQQEAYQKKLAKIQSLEKLEVFSLLLQLKAAENYEDNLVDNKFSYMEDFKAFSDLSVPQINPILSSKLQLYFNDHAEYFRIRNLERSQEEEKDKKDAEEELEEKETNAPVVVSTKTPQTSEPIVSDLVIRKFLDERLEQLKGKIGDLILEYLGVKEDVLIDFIYDFLLDNNLAEKETLISELQETLDEDSTLVVDEIYKFLRE